MPGFGSAANPYSESPFDRNVEVHWRAQTVGILIAEYPDGNDFDLVRVVPSVAPINVPDDFDQDPEDTGDLQNLNSGDEIQKDFHALSPSNDPNYWGKAYIEFLHFNYDTGGRDNIGHEIQPQLWGAGGDAFTAYFRGVLGGAAATWAASGPHTWAEVVTHYSSSPYDLDVLVSGVDSDVAWSGTLGTHPAYTECPIGVPNIGPTVSDNQAWFVGDGFGHPDCEVYFSTWDGLFARVGTKRRAWLINFTKLGVGGEVKLVCNGKASLDTPFDVDWKLKIYSGGTFFAADAPDLVSNTGGTVAVDDTRTIAFDTLGDLFHVTKDGFV